MAATPTILSLILWAIEASRRASSASVGSVLQISSALAPMAVAGEREETLVEFEGGGWGEVI